MACEQFSGAGVLVIEVPSEASGGELNLVVFHDKKKKSYTDPGGKCERHHDDPKETALAELYEETATLLDARDSLSTGYVEKQIGKRRKWYRAYFLFTEPIDQADYDRNVRTLRSMDAEKHLQETDAMARVTLSELYRTLFVDHPDKARPYVRDTKGNRIRLHRRLVDLLHVVFGGDSADKEPWVLNVLNSSPYGEYQRRKDSDGLIHYEY